MGYGGIESSLTAADKNKTWEQLHVFKDHTDGVASLDWSPDDDRLLTASHDHNVKMWFTNVKPRYVRVDKVVWNLRTDHGAQQYCHRLSMVPRWTNIHICKCR